MLLVEGNTPAHFFEAMLRFLGIDKTIEVWNFGGNQQLPTFLKTLASTAEFKRIVTSLGIVRDAEENAIAAKDYVTSAMDKAGLHSRVIRSLSSFPTI